MKSPQVPTFSLLPTLGLGFLLLAGCDPGSNETLELLAAKSAPVTTPAAPPGGGGGSPLLDPEEGPALPDDGVTHDQLVAGLNSGALSLFEVRQRGMLVFTTPFNKLDGHGDGPFDPAETDTTAFGQRPTLQGNGTSLRVNGLDSQSCNECHTIVSHRARPPITGIGGVGGIVQNAMIMASVVDVADAMDDRMQFASGHEPELPMQFDGNADYNGRLANPPFLFGGGGVELLAKEMTEDLQGLLAQARGAPVGTETALVTHGVDFGSLITTPGGDVDLNVEGIGFADNTGRAPEDVLVVRPFGRKGENFSMRDFDRGAMQFHFGMQPVEVVGPGVDPDRDGVTDEVTVAQMTALHIFDVTNPKPRDAGPPPPVFTTLGCVRCHMPVIETRSRFLPLAHPEVASDPRANVYTEIDLVEVGFTPGPGGGVLVPLFADLKRHDMGQGLAEDFERGQLANHEFTTGRLWGIADTSPYLHDGRATTLFAAIQAHGGEALDARNAFLALSEAEQIELIEFLMSLKTPVAPNEELR